MPTTTVGPLLREWRTRRRRSQLDLALDTGVSPRHLSFIETGRSRPSPEVVLALSAKLEVPLRERNRLLLAAGHAPRYAETTFDAPQMETVRAACHRLLDVLHPYPAVVVNGDWDVVAANPAAGVFVASLPPELREPTPNLFRASLHPDGLAPNLVNFEDWSRHLLAQLRQLVESSASPRLAALLAEISAYPNLAHIDQSRLGYDDIELVLPMRYRIGDEELALFTTVTTFATAVDVTVGELAVEMFFPADAQTEALLRRWAEEPKAAVV
jgi:transcriptional regulator with XRE-family HTH domain